MSQGVERAAVRWGRLAFLAALPPVVAWLGRWALELVRTALLSAPALRTPPGSELAPWLYVLATCVVLGVPLALYLRALARMRAGQDETGRAAGPLRLRGLGWCPFVRALCLGVGLWLCYQALLWICQACAPGLLESGRASASGQEATASSPLAGLVSGCVCAPILEEGWYRGAWLTGLSLAGAPFALANVLQAAAFGLTHFSPFQIALTTAFGLALGRLAARLGSAVPGMLAHALLNSPLPSAALAVLVQGLGLSGTFDQLLYAQYGAGLSPAALSLLAGMLLGGTLLALAALLAPARAR